MSASTPAALVALGVITVIALVLAIIGTGLTGNHLKKAGMNPMKYGIVLDAGSSHTTLFIYEWPAEKQNDTGVVSQRYMCNVTGGGISSYSSSPSGAGESLRRCMDQTTSIVPQDRWADTPLALGATAGMRLLQMSDTYASKAVLSSVQKVLGSYPFSYREAQIIAGQEEGIYGWITANYFLYNFIQFTWLSKWQWTVPLKSIGALDLGGASTQITFMTDEPLQGSPDGMTVELYGRKYHVYSHSYLCYGRDQAIKLFLSRLYVASPGSRVNNTCYPIGYEIAYNLSFIYDSPCTSGERPADYDPDRSVIFQGTANITNCKNVMSSIFNFSACSSSNCTFNGVWQPPVQGEFLAFSSFFYTMDGFNLTKTKASLEDTLQTFDSHCVKTWSEVTAQNPGIKADRLKDYCFQAYYVYTLLIEGYKFNTDSWDSITFQQTAGGGTLGWALGYMLNVTNVVSMETLPDLNTTAALGLGFLATLLILLFGCAVLVIVVYWA